MRRVRARRPVGPRRATPPASLTRLPARGRSGGSRPHAGAGGLREPPPAAARRRADRPPRSAQGPRPATPGPRLSFHPARYARGPSHFPLQQIREVPVEFNYQRSRRVARRPAPLTPPPDLDEETRGDEEGRARCLTEKSTRNEVDASAEYPLKAGGGKGGGGAGAGVICPVDMWMNGDREMPVNRHKNLGRGTG